MNRYTTAELRKRMARALDEVERGEAVVVERRGRRFRIVPEPAEAARAPAALLRSLDPSLIEGQWAWEWSGPSKPLRFVPRRGEKARRR